MPIDFTFNGVNTNNLMQGFKISACQVPGQGFADHFYVYLDLMQDATKVVDFHEVVTIDDDNPLRPNEALTFSGQAGGEGPKHEFQNIDLCYSHLVCKQDTKSRVLEFQYDPECLGGPDNTPITLSNTWDTVLEEGRLGKNYKLTLSGRTEDIVGLSLRQSFRDNQVLRICWYGSSHEKSFLQELIDRKDGWQGNPISFSIGDQEIELDHGDLAAIYIDHSYGSFLSYKLPTVRQIAQNINDPGGLARLELNDISPEDYFVALGAERGNKKAFANQILETVTFVVKKPTSIRTLPFV